MQFVWGTEASGTISNSGVLSIDASAAANSDGGAGATAFAQGIGRASTPSARPRSIISARPAAAMRSDLATCSTPARQDLLIINDGTIAVEARASAFATGGPADAAADARGMHASASPGTLASIVIDNAGDLLISGSGLGQRDDRAGVGGGRRHYRAVSPAATSSIYDIVNSGSIAIEAEAVAVQENGATAIAAAIGLTQRGGRATSMRRWRSRTRGTLAVAAAASAQGSYLAGGATFATGFSRGVDTPRADVALLNIAVTLRSSPRLSRWPIARPASPARPPLPMARSSKRRTSRSTISPTRMIGRFWRSP